MSTVNLLSNEKPSDEGPKEGSDHEGLEEEQAGAGGTGGGGGDPAVLAVGPARRPLTYTRDELLRLRHSPLVKRALEHAFAGNEALALVLKRRSDSPNEEDRGARGDAPNENHSKQGVYGRERRSADPRERVRKESEPSGGGIVLSPQRRSFTSGCGAPAAAGPPPPHVARTRPESPLCATAGAGTGGGKQPNPKPEPGRRIGSGRIMVRDNAAGWEEGEWAGEYRGRDRDRDRTANHDRERPPNHDRTANHDRATGERSVFDRRSFGRDSYSSDIKREREERFNNEKGGRDREDNRRSGGRYSQRRFEKDEEPEWFSGGPTSQLETIELRGFDEPVKNNGTSKEEAGQKDKWNNSGSRSPERWRSEAQPAQQHSTSTNSEDKDSGVESKEEASNEQQPDFNIDDFLKFDSIPDVLTNGSGEAEGGSRFSRWFQRDSPLGDNHYERLLHNIVDDVESTRLDQPNSGAGEAAHVFAPISPAAPPPSLLELLRRANAAADQRPEMNNAAGGGGAGGGGGGKIHSLEELEARLRPQHSFQPRPEPHDLAAFKRLLAQVSGGHAVPAAEQRAPQPQQPQQPQPMSLLQMLNKSMEQQQQKAQQPQIPQELLYKLLQVQQRQQHQQQQHQQQQQQQAAAAIASEHLDRELLARPEACAIIHGLKAGEITVQHLMQQLTNPGLQSRHRELLLTILRLDHQQRLASNPPQMGGSPLPTGVGVAAAPHLVVPPHHQPLRLSPLPHPAFSVSPIMATSPNALAVHHPGVPARIPSPRELAAHTQSIMQGALIKKKLEEQRENYRRRHEMQPKQPTPISFTPTSVLRKMTAEKEAEAPSPKPQQQWAQPLKMPQGRPIVKGNQSGSAPMGYAPSPAEYQQHYIIQQQQMAAGVRPFPHQQQRQPVPVSVSQLNNMARNMGANTTLHQLLVQSHQRTLNEMGASGGGASGGGDNQLTRWFSPELLARASAGKLPSVHVPNALSLEDLERHHHSPAPPVRN